MGQLRVLQYALLEEQGPHELSPLQLFVKARKVVLVNMAMNMVRNIVVHMVMNMGKEMKTKEQRKTSKSWARLDGL